MLLFKIYKSDQLAQSKVTHLLFGITPNNKCVTFGCVSIDFQADIEDFDKSKITGGQCVCACCNICTWHG